MSVDLAHASRLSDLSTDQRRELVDRWAAVPDEVRETVCEMAGQIRERGDEALLEYTERFDEVEFDELTVDREVREAALENAPEEFLEAFERAVEQIRGYHERQADAGEAVFEAGGVQARDRVVPVERAAIYAPGGTAAYPSTVAMTVVPASVAGVDEVTVASPPGPDGRPHELVLAACELLDVDRVVALGGAQAVLALAQGSESVPAHDVLVGPGNVYVQAAKEHVAGSVRVDAPAGPSEVAVLADRDADPGAVAREMAAQAEHDPRSVAIALCEGNGTAKRVREALADAIEDLPRRDVVEEALAHRGAVLAVDDTEEAVVFLDELAPEHCALLHRESEALAERLSGPACIVAGEQACVPLTDYVAGPSHVLPTGGRARSYSGVDVHTFTKHVHVARIDDVDEALADAAVELARLEGLEAHARAIEEESP